MRLHPVDAWKCGSQPGTPWDGMTQQPAHLGSAMHVLRLLYWRIYHLWQFYTHSTMRKVVSSSKADV
jgi:hypothetical protein